MSVEINNIKPESRSENTIIIKMVQASIEVKQKIHYLTIAEFLVKNNDTSIPIYIIGGDYFTITKCQPSCSCHCSICKWKFAFMKAC